METKTVNNDVSSAPAAHPGDAQRHHNGAAIRGLVVDDDPIIRTLLTECLKSLGLIVTEAGSGTECLRAVEHETYDVIFIDVVMPEMDGMEATAELRKRGVQSWIVVISSQLKIGEATLFDAAKALGADDAMQKPFNLATVAAEVKAILAKRN